MTNETALVILDDIFKKEERFKDKKLYKELACTYRKALEKQIPKKAKKIGDGYYKCGVCGKLFITERDGYFCKKCGKATDWSD